MLRRDFPITEHTSLSVGQVEPDSGDVPWTVAEDEGQYAIWLPHQCDEWVIAVGDRETVVARAEAFIAALAEAIAPLQ